MISFFEFLGSWFPHEIIFGCSSAVLGLLAFLRLINNGVAGHCSGSRGDEVQRN